MNAHNYNPNDGFLDDLSDLKNSDEGQAFLRYAGWALVYYLDLKETEFRVNISVNRFLQVGFKLM